MKTKEDILALLENVSDPEVPVLSVIDLGVVREVIVMNEETVEVVITPTYSGCPAMSMIATQIRMELMAHGFREVKVREVLSPAWTTDWMSEAGKAKLNTYGIAPPQYSSKTNPHESAVIVPCPLCGSKDTRLLSQFGSTACKALYQCNTCMEPFDYFKCH